MPYKRASKSKTKSKSKGSSKKSYKKRTNQPIRFNNTVSLGKGFPKKLLVTHLYSDFQNLSSVSGAIDKLQWSCNGLYDPFISGGGHQPYYFDQLNSLYNHYCVIGAKFSARIFPVTDQTVATIVGCFINDNTVTTATDIDYIPEYQTGSTKVLMESATHPVTFHRTWSAKKYFGKSVLANSELQGTSTSNPTEQSYFTIAIQSANRSASTAVSIELRIEYLAIWKELIDISIS